MEIKIRLSVRRMIVTLITILIILSRRVVLDILNINESTKIDFCFQVLKILLSQQLRCTGR